jgi:orotidine-5'-phosphate decarboxylase
MTLTKELAEPKLIVALDVDDFGAAKKLVERIAPLGAIFKLGYESLYGYGDALRAHLETLGADVFIDAKLHDIPRTVGAAMRALVRPGVRIVTVHALGGSDMMCEAVEAAARRARELGIEPPKVFAVTLLTSLGSEMLGELGLNGGPGENVIRLAALARDARCDGVVCGVGEIRDLKSYFGEDFLALSPGIRPTGSTHDDQRRVATPREAVSAGANYLVVGRPITEAANPLVAAQAILDEMAEATRERRAQGRVANDL